MKKLMMACAGSLVSEACLAAGGLAPIVQKKGYVSMGPLPKKTAYDLFKERATYITQAIADINVNGPADVGWLLRRLKQNYSNDPRKEEMERRLENAAAKAEDDFDKSYAASFHGQIEEIVNGSETQTLVFRLEPEEKGLTKQSVTTSEQISHFFNRHVVWRGQSAPQVGGCHSYFKIDGPMKKNLTMDDQELLTVNLFRAAARGARLDVEDHGAIHVKFGAESEFNMYALQGFVPVEVYGMDGKHKKRDGMSMKAIFIYDPGTLDVWLQKIFQDASRR